MVAKHSEFLPRKHRKGVLSQNPRSRESRIRERSKVGLEAAYSRIDTKFRVKVHRARKEVMDDRGLTKEQADQELVGEYAELERQKAEEKEEARRTFMSLAKNDDADVGGEVSEDHEEMDIDDDVGEEGEEDTNDPDFESDRDDASSDEYVNKEELFQSFQDILARGRKTWEAKVQVWNSLARNEEEAVEEEGEEGEEEEDEDEEEEEEEEDTEDED